MIDYEFSKKPSLQAIMESPNVCNLLDDADCDYIGRSVWEGYDNDLKSRKEWEDRQAEANKLALQVYEQKTYPWPGASNVKFPLVTVAAMQYASRAFPSLVNSNNLVKCKVFGPDPDGQKSARAKRISSHMTWQNVEQDKAWEADSDKGMLIEAIAGCFFRKRVYEPGPRKQVSMIVLPKNLVVNYWARDLANCERYTHTFPLNHNNIRQREMDKRFRAVTESQPTGQVTQDAVEIAKDQRQGTTKPQDDSVTPYFTGEQYCWWDLDGDGYEEPYIVTFDINTQQVRRIVARFLDIHVRNIEGKKWQPGDKVYKITPVEFFTKYPFVPSPDGGFYDLGLGCLAGPINESVNTTINQVLDQAHMATLGGGFLGRGFKSKSGPITFAPQQWWPVDSPGDDLRKSILPLPIREPSNVLFQLLGLLIQYGERIVGSTDIQVGENIGQNTPAETARTLNQNGARVYSAIRKRNWGAMRDEFRIQFDINSTYLTVDEHYEDLTSGASAMIRPDDYEQAGISIRPAADPTVASEEERLNKAKVVFANAFQVPGHNKYLATRRLYEAMEVEAIEEVLPPPTQPDPQNPQKMVPARDFAPIPNPKMMEQQRKDKEFMLHAQDQQFKHNQAKIELQMEVMSLQAEVNEMEAKAMKYRAEASGVKRGHDIAMLEASIGAKKARMEGLLRAIELMMKGQENGQAGMEGGGLGGMEAGPQNAGVPQVSRGNGQGPPGPMA